MRRIAAFGVVAVFALLAVCGRMSCDAVGESPIVVTPSAVVRMFRDSPARAAKLYEGRIVMLSIRNGRYTILSHPPVIVSDPPSDRSAVTVGVLRCRRDGVYTGDSCYFTLVIESAVHGD